MIWLEFIHVINVHLAAFECHSNFSDVIITQILSVTASTLTIRTWTESIWKLTLAFPELSPSVW
jgi:hypothetical protein